MIRASGNILSVEADTVSKIYLIAEGQVRAELKWIPKCREYTPRWDDTAACAVFEIVFQDGRVETQVWKWNPNMREWGMTVA